MQSLKRGYLRKEPSLVFLSMKLTFEGANRIPFLVTHDISVAYIYYEIHENTFETLCRNMGRIEMIFLIWMLYFGKIEYFGMNFVYWTMRPKRRK